MIRKTMLALAALAAAATLAGAQPAAAQNSVTCQSQNDDRNWCSIDTRYGVRLVRQLSSSPCVSGRTWGVGDGRVWVSRGCRAQFTVSRDGRWDDNGRRDDRNDRGRWDDRNDRGRASVARAERVCRQEVRERYRNTRGGVTVQYTGQDRTGNRVVRWRTERVSGTCRVNRNDRLVSFNRSR